MWHPAWLPASMPRALSAAKTPVIFPAETAIGALCRYVSTPQKHFAPMNINFGLLPPIDVTAPHRENRKATAAVRARSGTMPTRININGVITPPEEATDFGSRSWPAVRRQRLRNAADL